MFSCLKLISDSTYILRHHSSHHPRHLWLRRFDNNIWCKPLLRPAARTVASSVRFKILSEMKPFFILPVFLLAVLSAKDDDDEGRPCCPKKIVGGKTFLYFLNFFFYFIFLGKTYMYTGKLDKMEAMQYKCSNPCLYTMEGDDEDKKFCFKPGKQESKCAVGSTGMPNYSRTSPGGSRPPMTSAGPGGMSSRPPMTTGGSGGSGGLYFSES